MEVKILNLAGADVMLLQCEASEEVSSLKTKIASSIGMAPDRAFLLQLLSSNGKFLEDASNLSASGICSGEDLTLIRASAARLGALPEFSGFYLGTETEDHGRWTFEIGIDSVDFHETEDFLVEGVLHWRCVSGPFDVDPFLRGREKVRGTVQEDGSLHLKGFTTEPLEGLIICSTYSFRLADGKTLTGTFKGATTCDDEFRLLHQTEEEALAWRTSRTEDIRSCTHARAEEVRLGNGIVQQDNEEQSA